MRGKIPTAPAILVVSFLVLVAGICANSTTKMPAAIVDAVEQERGTESRLAPVEMWNRDHLAGLQAKEAEQQGAAIVEAGAWDLLVIKATGILNLAWRVVGLGLAVSALIAALGLGAMAFAGVVVVVVVLLCVAWERAKRARAYEPVQLLPDHTFLYPALGVGGNTLTGAQWKVTSERPASIDNGQLLIAARPPTWRELLVEALFRQRSGVAKYRFTDYSPGRRELYPATVIEAREELSE